MTLRAWSLAVPACCLTQLLAAAAFAQSGEIVCQQDLKRVTELYEQKKEALSEQDRQDVLNLMDIARSRCSAGGADALNTRSPEAVAILEKLENTPMPSQAAVPDQR